LLHTWTRICFSSREPTPAGAELDWYLSESIESNSDCSLQ